MVEQQDPSIHPLGDISSKRAIHTQNHQSIDVAIDWHPRRHRKGRWHRVLNQSTSQPVAKKYFSFLPSSMSWWVGFWFTLGSMIWLINGYFCMWRLANESAQQWVTALTAFAGGFIFIVGAYTALLEVFNRSDHIHISQDESSRYVVKPYKLLSQRLRWWRYEPKQWSWWMNILQMCGALVFFIACFMGVVMPLYPHLSLLKWFWMPQMIGAVFFIVAGLMAMLEVQKHWYRPEWFDIGWQAGLYNLIGAIGFFLCAWFGAYYHSSFDSYWGSDFSTFWGSIGFLVASYLMWYESFNPSV